MNNTSIDSKRQNDRQTRWRVGWKLFKYEPKYSHGVWRMESGGAAQVPVGSGGEFWLWDQSIFCTVILERADGGDLLNL